MRMQTGLITNIDLNIKKMPAKFEWSVAQCNAVNLFNLLLVTGNFILLFLIILLYFFAAVLDRFEKEFRNEDLYPKS